ncbi:MAG: hypothetical protein GDA35_08860, partial [Hyphomonadaceae bacterium]|nr:hypothetical protein [Hyphomonadaceae bacterium]
MGKLVLKDSSTENVRKIVETYRERFKQVLESRRGGRTSRPLVISNEGFSRPNDNFREMTRNTAEFLRTYSDEDIRVIAYVRSPRSFMSSMFQQYSRVEDVKNLNDLRSVWPHYRGSLQKFDHIFGRENVILKPFQRNRLEDGDVVLDFAREIGVALDSGEVIRINESISLEAVALLYVKWRFGEPFKPENSYDLMWHSRFALQISKLGSRRFVLSDHITDPLVEANRADLEWMEARLGAPLSEPAVPEGQGIGSEEELIAA